MKEIHPTAIVHPKAEIDDDVAIGPYSVIGEHVRIGRGCSIAPHVVIDGRTEIGDGCRVFPFASIGSIPQDLKFKGEETRLLIGKRNTIRESVTINRGTGPGGGLTQIGDDNLIMAYAHVAHDCRVGNHVILANAATLAGHIQIEDFAIVGGLAGIHQFVRVGAYSMIGGASAVPLDIPPFVSAAGNRAKLFGLNLLGLKRHQFSEDRVAALKKAYRIIFRSKLNLKDALAQVRNEIGTSEDVQRLVAFLEASERGFTR